MDDKTPEEIDMITRLKKQLSVSQQNQAESAILLRKMKKHVDDLIVNDPNSTLKLELRSASARETMFKEELGLLKEKEADQEKKIDALEKTVEAYKRELQDANEKIKEYEDEVIYSAVAFI